MKGCLDVRFEDHRTDIVPGTRRVKKTVSTLKGFRISETLYSLLLSFPTPTIQVSRYSAVINNFSVLSASCPCLFVCSKSFRVKYEPQMELMRGGEWPKWRRRGISKVEVYGGDVTWNVPITVWGKGRKLRNKQKNKHSLEVANESFISWEGYFWVDYLNLWFSEPGIKFLAAETGTEASGHCPRKSMNLSIDRAGAFVTWSGDCFGIYLVPCQWLKNRSSQGTLWNPVFVKHLPLQSINIYWALSFLR